MDNYSNTNNQNLKKFLDIVNQSKTIYNGKVIGQDGGSLIVKIEGKTLKLPSLGNKSSEVIVVRDKDRYSLLPSYNNFNKELYNITLRNRKRRPIKKKKQIIEIIPSSFIFLNFLDTNFKELGYFDSNSTSNSITNDKIFLLNNAVSLESNFKIYLAKLQYEYIIINTFQNYSKTIWIDLTNKYPDNISEYFSEQEEKAYATDCTYTILEFEDSSLENYTEKVITLNNISNVTIKKRDIFIEDFDYFDLYDYRVKDVVSFTSFPTLYYDRVYGTQPDVSFLLKDGDVYENNTFSSITLNGSYSYTKENKIIVEKGFKTRERTLNYDPLATPLYPDDSQNSLYKTIYQKVQDKTNYLNNYEYYGSGTNNSNQTYTTLTSYEAEGYFYIGGFGGISFVIAYADVKIKAFIVNINKSLNYSYSGIGKDYNSKNELIGEDILTYNLNTTNSRNIASHYDFDDTKYLTKAIEITYSPPYDFSTYSGPIIEENHYVGDRNYDSFKGTNLEKTLPYNCYSLETYNESFTLDSKREIAYYYFYKGIEKKIIQNYSLIQNSIKTTEKKEKTDRKTGTVPENSFTNTSNKTNIVQEKKYFELLQDYNNYSILLQTEYYYTREEEYSLSNEESYKLEYTEDSYGNVFEHLNQDKYWVYKDLSIKKYTMEKKHEIVLLDKETNTTTVLKNTIQSSFLENYTHEKNLSDLVYITKDFNYITNRTYGYSKKTYQKIDDKVNNINIEEETIENYKSDNINNVFILYNENIYLGNLKLDSEDDYTAFYKLSDLQLIETFKRSTYIKNRRIIFTTDSLALLVNSNQVIDKKLNEDLYFIVTFEMYEDIKEDVIDTYFFKLKENEIKLIGLSVEPVYKLNSWNTSEYIGQISVGQINENFEY